jgi:8-oxo-dGTP diphosphatase
MKRAHAAPAPAAERLILAAAIVIHYSRVLVVQRSGKEGFLPCAWGVPCGKLDGGEDPGEGALRELREETGLDGTLVRYVGHQTFTSTWKGQQVENFQSNFLVHATGVDDEEFRI